MKDYKVQCEVSGMVVMKSRTVINFEGKRVYKPFACQENPQDRPNKRQYESVSVNTDQHPTNYKDVSLTGYNIYDGIE